MLIDVLDLTLQKDGCCWHRIVSISLGCSCSGFYWNRFSGEDGVKSEFNLLSDWEDAEEIGSIVELLFARVIG